MGKKQRLKKERNQSSGQEPVTAKSSNWLKWLIGVAAGLALLLLAVVMVVRMNQDKLIKFSLTAMSQQVRQELNRQQAQFTLNDSQTMRELLTEIEQVSAEPEVDAVIGGNLTFMLNVLKEIIEQGNLRPDELNKIRSLLAETKRRLDVNKVKQTE